jgi:glycosyltransferase involved in cell wall biosynthesis
MTGDLRFGYVPYDDTLRAPGDRRRFCFWAERRGIDFEIARPDGVYDIVVLSARADIVTWARRPVGGPRLVYDLIDSYLDIPARSIGNRLRGLVKYATHELARPTLDYHGAMEAMCRRADAVVCSTPEQAQRIGRLSSNVHPILDAHVAVTTRTKSSYDLSEPVRFVWEGLPYTLDDFLPLAPVLADLARERPIALDLVTDPRHRRYAGRFVERDTNELARRISPHARVLPWDEATVAEHITAADIALVPLDLGDPLARGKPENKLLLLWRMGMPAIVSATPAYVRTMRAAGQDLTCTTADDWASTIRRVIDDDDLRARAGTSGLSYVRAAHDPEQTLARWDAVMATLT